MSAWRFGSFDLSAFGVVTLLDDYLDMPDSRGDNQVIPYRHGSIFVRKYFAERVIQMGLVVAGGSVADLESRLDVLRKLLSLRTQQTLYQYRLDGTVYTASATVERSLDISRPAPHVARLTIEFVLPQPFMRLSTIIADNTTVINASPKAMTVNNPGTIEERDPTILLTAPLTNPVITNSTNGVSLTYTGVIAGAETVTIATAATGEYTAVHSTAGNVIGNVTHAGSPALLVLEPGDNTLSITSGVATTGSVKISFYAPFI